VTIRGITNGITTSSNPALSDYDDWPIDDLREYAQAIGSEPLKGFYERVKRSCLQIFEEQARAVGRDMKAALDAQLASHEKNP
jgi:hypothetical protein